MDADSSCCGDFSPLCLTENSRGREGKTNNEGRGQLSKTDPVLSSVKDQSTLIQQVLCRCPENGLAVNILSFLPAITATAAVTGIQVVWLMHQQKKINELPAIQPRSILSCTNLSNTEQRIVIEIKVDTHLN